MVVVVERGTEHESSRRKSWGDGSRVKSVTCPSLRTSFGSKHPCNKVSEVLVTLALRGVKTEGLWSLLAFSIARKVETLGSGKDPT